MAKRKATGLATGAGRRGKRAKTTTRETFVWNPQEWKEKFCFKDDVLLLVKISDQKHKVVEKVLQADSSDRDRRAIEIQALDMLPRCNRIVRPIHYAVNHPDLEHGTAIYEHYPLGDLAQWRERDFASKNWKPVPESYIWRLFLQIAQALAVLQGRIGPDCGKGQVLLHRDIKPENILVVDNGTTYPSFKLHDFGVAGVYQKADASQPAYCGTFLCQPPENPIINTRAAEMWSLGVLVHYLATGTDPVQDPDDYENAVLAEHGGHPDSAQIYKDSKDYYAAHAARIVTSINLTPDQQQRRGIGPFLYEGRACYNPQYSDELNKWMKLCLTKSPSKRPTVDRLMNDMSVVAKSMLRKMGGKAALVDLDAKFGMDA